jgi:hypothetical protein
MDKLHVTCTQCQTTLGVPVSLAGKKVKCSVCKAVIDVAEPEEPVEVEPLAPKKRLVAQEAPKPKLRKKAKPEPAEEGEAPAASEGRAKKKLVAKEKKPEAPKRKAPTRRPSSRRKGTGRKSSKTPLIIGIGAVVLLAAAIGGILVFGRSGSEDGDGPTPEERAAKKAEAKERQQKEERYQTLSNEAETWEQHYRLGVLAKELGWESTAKKHWRTAVELAREKGENCRRVYDKLGYKEYKLPEVEAEISSEPSLLGELPGKVGEWFSPEEYDKLKEREKELLVKAREELEKRKRDPFHARMVEIQKRIDTMKGFGKLMFNAKRDDPYVVFEHVGKKGENPYRSEEAKKLTEEKLTALKVVFRFIQEKFMVPSGFKPPENAPMIVVSLEDREAFEAYNKDAGVFIPPGALAYFHRATKFIVMYNGQGKSIWTKREDDGILFHEATHQILSYFSQVASKSDPFLSHWFNEGMAEYIGQLKEEKNADGSYTFTPAHKMSYGRLREFYMARHPMKFVRLRRMGLTKGYALSLEEMVQVAYAGQAIARIGRKWVEAGGPDPQRGGPGVLGILGSLIYAQASSFFFFCYKHKPEKYADKLTKYFEKEMMARVTFRSAATFKKCFGVDDLKPIETEWLEYVDSITAHDIKEGH